MAELTAYCVKCRKKQVMKDPKEIVLGFLARTRLKFN